MVVGTTAGFARVKKSEEHTYCVVQYKKHEIDREINCPCSKIRRRSGMVDARPLWGNDGIGRHTGLKNPGFHTVPVRVWFPLLW